MPIQAIIIQGDRFENYPVLDNVEICSAGVIVKTPNSEHAEMLFPWHRVYEVTSSHVGMTRIELDGNT